MLILRDEIESLKRLAQNCPKVFAGYISHIRFPRYKNIADGTRIDFSFPITAFVGANGSGKTSALNALYGAPARKSTGTYWFSTKVDPIEEGEGSPSRFIYGHYNRNYRDYVETRKARVRKVRQGRLDPNYWEPTKESPGDDMMVPRLLTGNRYEGRSSDRWNPVVRDVLYINFRRELSSFDKYFYFGREPNGKHTTRPNPSTTDGRTARRINNKTDQIRHDAEILDRVISAGDTSFEYRGRKVATENRLMSDEELKAVSFVLGRDYVEARWIRHRLFKVEDGLSVVFKTNHGRYSEAFAGSGEIAVASCVVQILQARKGTLVLLDEPEVSLHPGAQERLLAFIANRVRSHHLQVVFSTHSPHLISALPNHAIKTFHQMDDGKFAVIPETHPYAAFKRLGFSSGGSIRVIVEDRLAKGVVEQALLTISDQAERETFTVEFLSGGSDTLLAYHIPILMHGPENTLVLLDGDKQKEQIPCPSTIPESDNGSLGDVIVTCVGVTPKLIPDGGSGGGNAAQIAELQRQYLGWCRRNLRFIPTSCPEELVLKASRKFDQSASGSQHAKDTLRRLAVEAYGDKPTSEQIDNLGIFMLSQTRSHSSEVAELAEILTTYLRQQTTPH